MAGNAALELAETGECSTSVLAKIEDECEHPVAGGHVVLRDLEGSQKSFHLSTKDLKMGKYAAIPVEVILATPFGAALRRSEVDDGSKWLRHDDIEEAEDAIEDESITVTETNAGFAQDNSAQALTPDEISALKKECSGEDVVAKIASSSATFASKTKFSQEKYLRKKLRKHLQQVVVLRPTSMELCETYMKTSRQKICGLRFDYLSSILCQADVRSGGIYFVLDCALGLVCGTMAQRLAGCGRIFRPYGGGVSDKAIQELDLGAKRRVVQDLPLDVLQSADPMAHEWVRLPPLPAPDVESTPEERSRREARTSRVEQRRKSLREFQASSLDAVIIVAGDEESDLAAEAIEVGLAHLSPGGRLIIYGQNLQPLAARQGAMRSSGDYVDVRLTQLFTREFQVLPQRTHPHMAAEVNHCEGFLLAASRVAPSKGADEAQLGSPPKRRKTNDPQ